MSGVVFAAGLLAGVELLKCGSAACKATLRRLLRGRCLIVCRFLCVVEFWMKMLERATFAPSEYRLQYTGSIGCQRLRVNSV